MHQYNTGDDDEDGIPGSIDPDDFGPGPTTEVEGLYYVQYLAWDETLQHPGRDPVGVRAGHAQAGAVAQRRRRRSATPAYEQVECFLATRRVVAADPNPYVNPGASADDQCYGDLNQEVVPFGEVNKQVPGTYELRYQVRDGAYNWATEVKRFVEVIDSLQPTVTDRNTTLGTAEGNMRQVELSQCAEADDRCEGYLPINLYGGVTNITSNEPGDDAGDIIFDVGSSTFQLRAEANPTGTGRVYTVEFTVSDSSGNPTSSQCLIRVPPPPRIVSPVSNSVSNTSTPTYTGTAEPNTTVSIYVDTFGAPVGTTPVDAAGAWSFTQPTALANGNHTVRAVATNAFGSARSADVTFRVQTQLAGR